MHALPTTTTLNKPRTPTLLYNSAHIYPTPLVNAEVTLPSGSLPDSVQARVFIGAVQKGFSRYNGSEWGAASNTRRITVSVDGSSYATSRQPFKLEIKRWSGGVATVDSVKSKLVIVNREASHFGAGWWLAGLERVVVVHADTLLWIGGDGSARVYSKSGSYYYAPTFDRPDSVSVSGSDYIRWAPARTEVKFNSSGLHTTTTNRLGHVTTFHYTSARLDSISLPPSAAAKRYKFTYAVSGADTVLSQVTGPANGAVARNVTTTRSGKKILTFTDPDTSVVTFTYGTGNNQYRVDSRTDRRNKTTSFTYDVARRLTRSRITISAVNIDQDLVAAETRGLPSSTSPTAQPLDSVYSLINGPRTDVTDITKIWINGYGAPLRTRDANGKESQLKYNSTWKGLVAQTRTPSRLLTKAFHHSTKGTLDSTKVYSPYDVGSQIATTKYQWDSKWRFPTSIRSPDNVVDSMLYDTNKGTRTWAQRGGASYRVSFSYTTDGLDSTVTEPDSGKFKLLYDATVRNLRKTITPKGYVTFLNRDNIGRVALTATQTDTSTSDSTSLVNSGQRDSLFYDITDQIKSTTKVGPTTSTAPDSTYTKSSTSLRVEHTYDKEGNVTATARKYSVTGVAKTINSSWVYDDLGRMTSHTPPGGGTQSTVYDKAGNVTSVTSPRSLTVSMTYDPANRLTKRIVPQVSYGSIPCSTFGHPACSFSIPVIGSSVCIDADTAQFTYDASGNILTANNMYARVKRSYYRNGALATDTLRIRTWHNPMPTGCASASSEAPTPGYEFTLHVYALRHRYDLSGRRTALRHPDALESCAGLCDSVRYNYDATRGLLSSVVDFGGSTSSFSYDNTGRLTTIALPGGWSDTRTYDVDERVLTRNAFKAGVATAIADTLRYDAQGRQLRARAGIQGGAPSARTIDTWYGPLGAVVAQDGHTASGTTEHMAADALGNRLWRKQYLMKPPGHPDQDGKRQFTIDNAGRITGVEAPYHAQYFSEQTLSYDNSGNNHLTYSLETDYYQSGTLADQSVQFWAADDRLRVVNRHIGVGSGSDDVRPGQRGVFEEYWYDALGRRVLTRSRRNAASCTVSDAECANAVQRTVWDGDQVLWEIRAKGGTSASAGDLESESTAGTVSDGYAFGRVAYVHAFGIDQPIGVKRYAYNGLSDGTLLVPYTNWRGMYEAGSIGSGSASGSLQASCGGGTGCPLVDWPGTQVAVDGATPDPQAGSSWMGSLIAQGTDGSGLQYRRNRYYNPQTGQFTQEDPIGLAGGTNLYGFASGDPVNFSDPFGLCPYVLTHRACSTGKAVGIGFVPIIGDAIEITGAALGQDLLTGESIGGLAVGATIAGTLAGSGKLAREGTGFLGRLLKRAPVPIIDASGKVHARLPGHIPGNWTRDQLEELAGDLRSSIRTRKLEQSRLGEDGPHRRRIFQEERLLRQIDKRLGGS